MAAILRQVGVRATPDRLCAAPAGESRVRRWPSQHTKGNVANVHYLTIASQNFELEKGQTMPPRLAD